MRNIVILFVAFVVSCAFAGMALADGAATFVARCATCHGQNGEGMGGMAPALKGNKFITDRRAEDIKQIIPLICPGQVFRMQTQMKLQSSCKATCRNRFLVLVYISFNSQFFQSSF